MTCVCHSFHLFRGIGTKHTRKFNCSHFSTLIEADPSSKDERKSTKSQRRVTLAAKYEKVGITETIDPLPKVLASIRKRSSFFQVHEIDLRGRKIQLTSFNKLPAADPTDVHHKYIHFTLYKQERQTSEVIGMLDGKFRKYGAENGVTYAGLKDNWAITTQRVSIQNFSGAFKILPRLFLRNIKLGNFSYAPYALQLGDLNGNHFKILLTDVRMDESIEKTENNFEFIKSALDESMQNFRDKGFINYFGLQRFGTNAPEVGAAVLASNWEKVFDLILTPHALEKNEIAYILSMWPTTRDPEAMLKLIPPHLLQTGRHEMKLLVGLSKYYDKGQGSLIDAYKEIPWFLRQLYLSSFRSYIWNQVASCRVKEFGLEIIPGDYVLVDEKERVRGNKAEVKMLTQEDVQSGQYSIYDVVLPILGRNIIQYDNSLLQEVCSEIFAQYGLDPNCFATFTPRREIEQGFYRHLLVKPFDVAHQVIAPHACKDFAKLMPSDLDLFILNKSKESKFKKGPKMSVKEEEEPIDFKETIDPAEDPKINRNACAVVEFSLPPSCYATMALREIIQ